MISEEEYKALISALKQTTEALEEFANVIDNQGEELIRLGEEVDSLKIKVNQ